MCPDPDCCVNGPGWSQGTALAFSCMGDRKTDFTLLTANLIGQGNSKCSADVGWERGEVSVAF